MTIPDNFPVKVLAPGDPATGRATCGTCHRSWDDAIPTDMTPVPAGRCPFEHFHDDNTIDDTNAITLGRNGEELEWVTVTDLQPGDRLELTGDKWADPDHGSADHECPFGAEYFVVGHSAALASEHGFPRDHLIPRVKPSLDDMVTVLMQVYVTVRVSASRWASEFGLTDDKGIPSVPPSGVVQHDVREYVTHNVVDGWTSTVVENLGGTFEAIVAD